MPVRKRLTAIPRSDVSNPVSCFKWSCNGSGLDSMVGGQHYGTRREAERAWRQARRIVWASTPRFRVPRPARYYDGLTECARDVVWHGWNDLAFDLDDALEAVAVDRANLARFASTKDARSIGDYRVLVDADLTRIEQGARELAAFTPTWRRPFPLYLTTGRRYGDKDATVPEDTAPHGDGHEETEYEKGSNT